MSRSQPISIYSETVQRTSFNSPSNQLQSISIQTELIQQSLFNFNPTISVDLQTVHISLLKLFINNRNLLDEEYINHSQSISIDSEIVQQTLLNLSGN